MEKLNASSFSLNQTSLGLLISANDFAKIVTRGLWSVITVKCGHPFKKNPHFWMAQAIAKHSSSIIA